MPYGPQDKRASVFQPTNERLLDRIAAHLYSWGDPWQPFLSCEPAVAQVGTLFFELAKDPIGETGKVGGLLGERRAALITAAVTGQIDVRGNFET